MNNTEIILKTKSFIRSRCENEKSGHDWWHIYRVSTLAKYIATLESADIFIVELTALLHDIADWKFHEGDLMAGPLAAKDWLKKLDVDKKIINKVCDIILNMSFKGANVDSKLATLEGMVVQDADRLDAIGAIGIARAFTYSGALGQIMHDPNIKEVMHNTFYEYKNKKSTAINHFHEKLLLLKDRMNTNTAKKMALQKHQCMEYFLENFYREWSEIEY